MPRFAGLRNVFVDALSGPRMVFHHVPKCGGTSVAQALRLRYAFSFAGFPSMPLYRTVEALHPGIDPLRRARLVDQLQEQFLLYYLFNDVRCVSGHVPFSNLAYERFTPSYKFVTTLREPVSLMISHYFFQSERPADLWSSTMDIDAYLETAEAREFGAVYSYFFNGLPRDADAHSSAAVEQAKSNLRRFDVVGLVDDMAGFQNRLRERVGVRLRIGYANRSKASPSDRSSVVTPETRRKMAELNLVNTEIYEFVKRELAC